MLTFVYNHHSVDKKPFNTAVDLYILIAFIITTIVALHFIPQTTRVSRAPAIVNWLADLLNGKFPYGSEINPSGFPMLFFISMLFYFIGDLGYLEVIGVGLFLFLVIKYSTTKKELLTRLIFFFLLPTTYYEIVVRSELLTNSVLVIGIFYLFKRFHESKVSLYQYFFSAILFGLLLSTRLIVFLWLVLFIIYYFKNDLRNGFIFLFISITVFLLTLVPFYLWSPQLFISKGPLTIQTIYLPGWVYILFPVFILYFGWKIKDFNELLFYTGVLTFALVSISFSTAIYNFGFNPALFQNRFDISYYIFSVPFLILSLRI